MAIYLLNNYLASIEAFLCVAVFATLVFRRQVGQYLYFALFIAVKFSSSAFLGLILWRAKHFHHASLYKIYFPVYWLSYACEAALLLFAIYGMYRLSMAPLAGLQHLGIVVFRWVVAISIAVSIGMAFGPNLSSHDFVVRVVTQLQQTSSILTLCLLLFVCFAIRPMGLSYRSRIFGVSFGLGLLATDNLVSSAWIIGNKSMYSTLSLVASMAACASFAIWVVYFVLPEPKRRMIVLPTTSPFLRWNQISLALGDEPGFVAVGGIPPEMFADAEIEIMTRASRKMFDYSS